MHTPLPGMQTKFQPNMQTALYLVYCVGIVGSFILLLTFLLFAAWLLNMFLSVCSQIAFTIGTFYTHAPALLQLTITVLVCIGLLKLLLRTLAREKRG